MTDILLTHGYFLSRDEAEQRIMRPYVPLGILSIAAYLDAHGFTTSVFDSTFRDPADFDRALEAMRPPVVGISVNMMTKTNALAMAASAKGHGALVIVGGPEPAYYAEEFLAQGIDLVVIGEGELTMEHILSTLKSGGRDFSTVPGVVFRNEEGIVVRTNPRPLIPSPGRSPHPRQREGRPGGVSPRMAHAPRGYVTFHDYDARVPVYLYLVQSCRLWGIVPKTLRGTRGRRIAAP